MLNTESAWHGSARLPVLTERQLAAVQAGLDGYSCMPRGSSPGRIAKLLATASFAYPAVKLNPDEADARQRLYQSELGDIHHEILGAAFSAAVREIRFFPSIAELRALAAKVAPPRRFVIARRLRALLDAQPAPEPLYVDASEVRALVSRMSGALSAA